MKTCNNDLKKIIKRLPNDGVRCGWISRTQTIIKNKRLPPVSNSLLYALVNDNTPLTTKNMYLATIIVQAVDELTNEFEQVKTLIEEYAN